MTNGIFNTGSNKVVVNNNSPSAISGGNTNSYVNGYLRRYIATNTGTYQFPLGDGTRYALFTLLNNNLTGTSYLTGKFTNSFTNSGSLNPSIAQDGGTAYQSICPEGIWQIDANSQPTGGSNYGVQLWFNDGGGSNSFTGLVNNQFGPLKRSSSSTSAADWSGQPTGDLPAAGQPGRTVASGYAKRTNITSFSQFAIGKSNDPLPIFLSDIKASCDDGKTIIEWTVESEINVAYYDITKSDDAVHFTSVGIVSAQGNEDERTIYDFTDYDNPQDKNVYYQIQQVNLNGSVDNYPIISSICHGDNSNNDIVIQQTDNNLSLTLFIPAGKYKVVIFDNVGRKIRENTILSSFSGQTFILDGQLASGLYNVVVYSDDLSVSRKLVVGK